MAHANGASELRERPIGELLRELSSETTELVRQELALVKSEMAEKGRRAGEGAGMFGGAGVGALLGLGALTAAAIAALATGMETWLAALIVGAVWLAVAGALALNGRNRVQEAGSPAPEQAMQSVKEDVRWAKTRAQSGRK
jgi:hypothetical protein